MLILPTKILSRGLPKTGQETCYQPGDDGYYEYGWWLGLLNVNNRRRFIEKEYVSGESVIIDLATRLMWPKDFGGAATDSGDAKDWVQAIIWCETLSFGGFSDWRLPNLLEFLSLMNLGRNNPCFNDDIFDGYDITSSYWTSSTRPGLSTDAQRAYFTTIVAVGNLAKSSTARFAPVRSI